MTKPTHASVTEEPCRCNYLQRAADDPNSPIVFDPELHEYNIEYTDPDLSENDLEHPSASSDGACEGTKAMLRIYHCPFCGGAAPESKRDLLFAVIPHGMTRSFPEEEGNPPTIQSFRTLTYRRLSETAEVCIFDDQKGPVQMMLRGKYVGPRKNKGWKTKGRK